MRKKPAAQLGTLKSDLHDVEVDNPLYFPQHHGEKWNARKTRASRNILESAIETMFARRSIDDAQKKAADTFRAICENMGAAGARAFDYTSVRVDGGLRSAGIPDQILQAGAEMKECHRILDRIDFGAFDILWNVAGLGKALAEMRLSPRDLIWARAVLKASLNALAVHWGYKTLDRSHPPILRAESSISVYAAALSSRKSPDTIKRWCRTYGIGFQLSARSPWRVDPIGLTVVLSGDPDALSEYQASPR